MNELECRAFYAKEAGYDCYDSDGRMVVIPVLFLEAIRLFDNDVAVLLLHNDGSETYADSAQDIYSHAKLVGSDMFGVECNGADDQKARRILSL